MGRRRTNAAHPAKPGKPSYLRPVPSPSVLPTRVRSWPLSSADPCRDDTLDPLDATLQEVQRYARRKPWVWPSRQVYFFCDVHADADALLLSLEASGGVVRTGPGDLDYRLTDEGRDALFVMGGDYLDKGPANLRLLRCLEGLIELGADVKLLAGNHDLRTYLGLHYAGRRETRFEHLFVRMGKKTLPLFKEILDEERQRGSTPADGPPDDEVRQRLYPSDDWYEKFETEARGLIPEKKLQKELQRIREKTRDLDTTCATLGMTLGDVYFALQRARQRFLEPDGDMAWLFERMTLCHREGSFLFIHAGVDDVVARALRLGGVAHVNDWYSKLLVQDPFELYHGSVGNAFRTKYRDIDFPLSRSGVADLHAAGIYAIVHGHRNILHGQRVTLRGNVLNFECDASVDCNTRKIEGLGGPGGAAVVFDPRGKMRCISTDYPFVKELDPARVFDLTSVVNGATTPSRRQEMTMSEQSEATNETGAEVENGPDSVNGAESKKRKSKIKFAARMQRDEAVTYFRALVDGLAHGRIELKQGDDALDLSPAALVSVEVKAAAKGDKQKVSFELEWKTAAQDLDISS